jgi:hypothetical protein
MYSRGDIMGSWKIIAIVGVLTGIVSPIAAITHRRGKYCKVQRNESYTPLKNAKKTNTQKKVTLPKDNKMQSKSMRHEDRLDEFIQSYKMLDIPHEEKNDVRKQKYDKKWLSPDSDVDEASRDWSIALQDKEEMGKACSKKYTPFDVVESYKLQHSPRHHVYDQRRKRDWGGRWQSSLDDEDEMEEVIEEYEFVPDEEDDEDEFEEPFQESYGDWDMFLQIPRF